MIHRRRPFAILGAMILAAMVVAQPAAAYKELDRSGTVYEDGPNVVDEFAAPGVTCRYVDVPGSSKHPLQKIKMRQVNIHSPYEEGALVGFRMQVTRNLKPFGDNQYHAYKATSLVKKSADQESVAFFKGSVTVPSSPRARYRVVLKFTFYNPSGSPVGGLKGRLEAYRHKLAGSPGQFVVGDVDSPGYCSPVYPTAPTSAVARD